MKIVVLDTEAVHALSDVSSNKHRQALTHVEAEREDRRRRSPGTRVVVPATVRIEAGWDRSAPGAAFINRLRIDDHYLAEETTNVAAGLRVRHGVSPADAHIGAVLAAHSDADVVVLTSDPPDIAAVAEGKPVRIIRL